MKSYFENNQMKNKLKGMRNLKSRLLGLCTLGILISACNTEFEKVIPASPELGSIEFKRPKLLYVVVDGARGTTVRDANIPVMQSLLPNSIYSWNSLADENGLNATNWASMITGVSKSKHNVLSEDFAGNKLSDYPAIFERIKSVNENFRIASFTSSDLFKNNLTKGADVSELLTNDLSVKNRLVDFLKADTASMVVAQFGAIDAAGKAAGYDAVANPAYKTAIETFDTQLGEVMNAIKNRSTYDKENWMVIIASNKGGDFTLPPAQDDKTVFSNTEMNTFSIIYNASFTQTFIVKPYVGNPWSGNAPRFRGDPERTQALLPDSTSRLFNFGDTTSFTISIKIKKRKNPLNTARGDYYYEWPSFLGKKTTSGWGDNEGPGWEFSLMQNRWRFFISGGTDFRNGEEICGANISGDTWHDLTAVVEYKPDGRKYVRVYTDGVMGITNKNDGNLEKPATTEFMLNGKPNFDNNARLRLGYTGGQTNGNFGKIDVNLADFKIFNVALTEEVIKQHACETSIDPSHPNYANLIGYWPLDEGNGTDLSDMGPFAANFTLNGTQIWEQYTDLVCAPSITNVSGLVPKNADMPAQILSWFNIARKASWGLDGKVWITN